jgi:hypothetical protein
METKNSLFRLSLGRINRCRSISGIDAASGGLGRDRNLGKTSKKEPHVVDETGSWVSISSHSENEWLRQESEEQFTAGCSGESDPIFGSINQTLKLARAGKV